MGCGNLMRPFLLLTKTTPDALCILISIAVFAEKFSNLSDMGQFISTGPVVCKRKEDLVRCAWASVKSNSVNEIINLEVGTQVHGFHGYIDTREKEYVRYTPLVIACMSEDFKLAKKLIDVGADINLRVRSYEQQEKVPPLYYAIAARDADIVKLLLDSGADVNEYKGYKQFINLQKPETERYSIILSKYSINLPAISDRPWSPMTKVLELYLLAGAKLNTTRWGHCFFYGRGKVYESRNCPLGIPDPCFSCDTVVLLLQHGIDPDQYKLSDVLQQFSYHYHYNRYRLRRDCTCVGFHILLHIFIAAGYKYTSDDLDSQDTRIKMKEYGYTMEEPLSLLQSCRSLIRKHLQVLNKDTTIFPSVDKLPIPLPLKEYLKLYNIIDLNNSLIDCYIY